MIYNSHEIMCIPKNLITWFSKMFKYLFLTYVILWICYQKFAIIPFTMFYYSTDIRPNIWIYLFKYYKKACKCRIDLWHDTTFKLAIIPNIHHLWLVCNFWHYMSKHYIYFHERISNNLIGGIFNFRIFSHTNVD